MSDWGSKASYYGFQSNNTNHYSYIPLVALLNLHAEGILLREVKNILEELEIMLSIIRRQSNLMTTFCRHAENILDPESQWRGGGGAGGGAALDASSIPYNDDDTIRNDFDEEEEEEEEEEKEGEGDEIDQAKHHKKRRDHDQPRRKRRRRRKWQLQWFRRLSMESLGGIQARINELEDLRESAKSTEQSVSQVSIGNESYTQKKKIIEWHWLISETTTGRRLADIEAAAGKPCSD